MRIRDHVVDIAGFGDVRLFAEIAEGIPHIVASAEELGGASEQLFAANEFRASDIVKGHAEEEAAKILILLDSVRCPPKAKARAKILKGFYRHVPKRIYAVANSRPNILSFGEMADFVDHKRQPFYLDGPSGARRLGGRVEGLDADRPRRRIAGEGSGRRLPQRPVSLSRESRTTGPTQPPCMLN